MQRAVASRLVVLSSVNGHGAPDAPAYVAALRIGAETSRAIGGKLDVAGSASPGDYVELVTAGFDHVFVGDHSVQEFRDYLSSNFALAEAS